MSKTRFRLLKVQATHVRMDAGTSDPWAQYLSEEVTEHLHVLAKGTHG